MDTKFKQLMALTPDERMIKTNIDLAVRSTGNGALTQALTNTLMGFNHRGSGIAVPVNSDVGGLTFFTRPRLNLAYDNVSQDRTMTMLVSRDRFSYQRMIRAALDPKGARGDYTAKEHSSEDDSSGYDSALFDNRCAFIPVLSNFLLNLSGWPDPVAEYFDSTPGVQREQWSMIDGPRRMRGTFDLSASWRNIAGDPITSLLQAWVQYGLNVKAGVMVPYPEAIIEQEIDYQSRVYRFLLDPSRRFVTKVAATIMFPLSPALGNAFNFSSDSYYHKDNQEQIATSLHCVGAEYQDPILFYEFNQIVAHFNPDMVDGRRERVMRLLRYDQLSSMNYYGYPRVDPYTFELQWWVPAADSIFMFGDN